MDETIKWLYIEYLTGGDDEDLGWFLKYRGNKYLSEKAKAYIAFLDKWLIK